MTDAAKSIRFPAAVLALINAECDRSGKAFSAVVIDACLGQLGGGRPEQAPASKPPAPTPPRRSATAAAPKAERARTALAAAEGAQGVKPARMVGAGVSVSAAMERAGTYVYDGSKRPAYQKGQAGQGKAGKGRGR